MIQALALAAILATAGARPTKDQEHPLKGKFYEEPISGAGPHSKAKENAGMPDSKDLKHEKPDFDGFDDGEDHPMFNGSIPNGFDGEDHPMFDGEDGPMFNGSIPKHFDGGEGPKFPIPSMAGNIGGPKKFPKAGNFNNHTGDGYSSSSSCSNGEGCKDGPMFDGEDHPMFNGSIPKHFDGEEHPMFGGKGHPKFGGEGPKFPIPSMAGKKGGPKKFPKAGKEGGVPMASHSNSNKHTGDGSSFSSSFSN